MKFSLYQKRLSHLHVQRNFLLGLCAILLMLMMLQTVLLFFKRERIVISPPELKQSYWIKGDNFSKTYIEEMALFFSHLLLDVSADNILSQGDVVLRYVKPENYGEFKGKLLSDQKRLKKYQLSLSFTPRQIEFINPMVVEIQGVLANFVGNAKVEQFQETYRMTLGQNRGQLFLESFTIVKTEREDTYE
jgi:conjugal transfer pilus assembly protein TraE